MKSLPLQPLLLEKTRYEIRRGNAVKYFCVTHTRTQEEVLGVLKKRWEDIFYPYTIFKIKDGKEDLIYSNNYSPKKRPIPVL